MEVTMPKDELAQRVAKLEAELAEAKKALEALKPEEPFRPRMTMQPIDYTENFRLPAHAAQKMAAVVPDVKGQKFDPNAWARNRIAEPGGFGPPKGNWPKGPTKVQPKDQLKVPQPPKSYWSK
jgi:hypothetical protein